MGTDLLLELGIIPWSADPELSATFFRPVSALTHMADYALWPDTYWLQHLHSRLWYALSAGVAFMIFRRFGLPLTLAGLAGLMFAVEEAHGLNMGWLANRNASIALIFGMAAIYLHHRFRSEQRVRFLVGGASCFLLAMFSAEAGVGALAYIVAWELTMEEGSWLRRAITLLPYGLALLGWLLVYKALGHGVIWSDIYVDPGSQPGRFALATLERFPLMVIAQWLQVPIDICNLFSPLGRILFSGSAWMLTIALGWWLWPLLKADRTARFWALGMALSFIPLCAAFPMVRVLTFSGLGAFALLAMKLRPWFDGETAPTPFQRLLVFGHVHIAAVMLMLYPLMWAGTISFLMPVHDLPGDVSPHERLILVNSHDLVMGTVSLKPYVDGTVDEPLLPTMLGSFLADLDVRRVDTRTLEVTATDGWHQLPLERLVRSHTRPFQSGAVISMKGYRVRLIDLTESGHPRTVHFEFDRPLEDTGYRWFVFEFGRLRVWAPPRLGESTFIPSVQSAVMNVLYPGSGPQR